MHLPELTDDELQQAIDEAAMAWHNATGEARVAKMQQYITISEEEERRIKLREEGKPDVLP